MTGSVVYKYQRLPGCHVIIGSVHKLGVGAGVGAGSVCGLE